MLKVDHDPGVLYACYRFPLTPIKRGVENWNLSWQL